MAQKMADRTCSVCLEQLRDPKILPCCHTFCLKCLERTVTRKAEITCPLCRKTHAIPAGGLKDFLTDFIVSHEVEAADLRSKKAQVCGECECEGPVESYCCDCQAYLCKECSTQAHKKLRSYRGHKVIPVQDVDVASLQSNKVHYCSTHKNEVMKLYCETCSKLICRDCTLVDHRQHSYKFAHDACMQINSQLRSLVKDGKQRLTAFKANLEEIQKVETTATSYPEVCKADINAFFDAAIQCIERRRQYLLTQAETEGQKDLKQIWADKDFHQTAISQFDAALELASKACKCTSDIEMILTAQQSIRQLSQLKEVKWDASAFTTVASSPGKFREGTRMEMNRAGCIDRMSFNNMIAQNLPATAKLGQTITFKVMETLLNGRSKQRICLQNTAVITETRIQVLVKYGTSQKAHKNVIISQDQETTGGLVVTVRLVCGGKHTIEIEFDGKPIKGSPFALDVTGAPEAGACVRHGPDWKAEWGRQRTRLQLGLRTAEMMSDKDANEQGTVKAVGHANQYGQRPYIPQLYDSQYGPRATTATTVVVHWSNGYTYNHNWGGPYDIELV